MPRSMLDSLTLVRELIEAPESWIQNNIAEDADGHPTFVSSPTACRFCLLGAICRVTASSNREKDLIECLHAVDDTRQLDDGIPEFNDTATHDEVLSILDRAISAASSDLL